MAGLHQKEMVIRVWYTAVVSRLSRPDITQEVSSITPEHGVSSLLASHGVDSAYAVYVWYPVYERGLWFSVSGGVVSPLG